VSAFGGSPTMAAIIGGRSAEVPGAQLALSRESAKNGGAGSRQRPGVGGILGS
jgi:hypothetical protein